jgi:two-component system response regulator AtoC
MTRILVVEDDEACRAVVCDMLAGNGYEVTAARDGNEALALMGARPADIVLTDVLMPDKDGLEVIREIVRQFPATRVLAMSGTSRWG